MQFIRFVLHKNKSHDIIYVMIFQIFFLLFIYFGLGIQRAYFQVLFLYKTILIKLSQSRQNTYRQEKVVKYPNPKQLAINNKNINYTRILFS